MNEFRPSSRLSITMNTSKPSLTSLPPELRAVIFYHVFRDRKIYATQWITGTAEWKPPRGPSPLYKTHNMNVFRTCRSFYEEARSVFASYAKLEFDNIRPMEIPQAIQEYYYPRIRKISIDLDTEVLAEDLAPFIALKQLKLYKVDGEASAFTIDISPATSDAEAGRNFLDGVLDAELKRAARQHYVETSRFAWVRDLLQDSKRSYKIVTTIIADWCVGRSPGAWLVGRLVSASLLVLGK